MTMTFRQIRKVEAIHHGFHRQEHYLMWNTRPSSERTAMLQKLIEARNLELAKVRGS